MSRVYLFTIVFGLLFLTAPSNAQSLETEDSTFDFSLTDDIEDDQEEMWDLASFKYKPHHAPPPHSHHAQPPHHHGHHHHKSHHHHAHAPSPSHRHHHHHHAHAPAPSHA